MWMGGPLWSPAVERSERVILHGETQGRTGDHKGPHPSPPHSRPYRRPVHISLG